MEGQQQGQHHRAFMECKHHLTKVVVVFDGLYLLHKEEEQEQEQESMYIQVD